MKHRLFNLLTLLCAVSCAAMLVLWVWSSGGPHARIFVRDEPLWGEMPRGPVYYELRSEDGRVSVTAIEATREKRAMSWLVGGGPVEPPGRFAPDPSASNDYGVFAVASGRGSMYFGEAWVGPVVGYPAYRTVAVSYLFFAAIAGLLPAARLSVRGVRALHNELRRDAGRCPTCGYDLRATPGRCPECGASTSASGER